MTSDFAIAVHALVYLNHKQVPQSSEQLAANVCTHPVRVRRVMARLKRAGLVRTREGAAGGSLFCREAAKVSLLQVAVALQETPVDIKYRTGDLDMDCAVASGMAGIMDAIYKDMNGACYGVLDNVTIADIDKEIFHRGGENDKKV